MAVTLAGFVISIFLVQKIQNVNKKASIEFTYNETLLSLRDDYYTVVAEYITNKDKRVSGEYKSHTDLNKDGVVNTLDYASLRDLVDGTSLGIRKILNPQTSNPDQLLAQMVSVAQQRKEVLLAELENDPNLFLEHAVLGSERESFPDQVNVNIEENAQVEGKMVTGIAEDFETYSKTVHGIYNESTNTGYSYYPTNEPEGFPNRSIVQVQGVKIDDKIAGQTQNLIVLEPGEDLIPIHPVEGNFNLGIILLNHPWGGLNQKTVAQANTIGQQISDYFLASSNNKLKLNRTANSPPFVIENPDEDNGGWTHDHNCGDYWTGWAHDLITEIENEGIDLSEYDHYLFITEENYWCNNGMAAGGWPSYARSRDNWGADSWAHEVAHNIAFDDTLSVQHAGMLNCVTYTGNCNIHSHDEYGDKSDIMGCGDGVCNYNHFNIPHMVGTGWVEPGNIFTHERSNSSVKYDFVKLGKYPFFYDDYQVIVIPRGDGWNYYLSTRFNYGTGTLPETYQSGLSVHIWNGSNATIYDDTRLVRLGGTTWADAPLPLNTYFRDDTYNIDFKYVDVGSDRYVHVRSWPTDPGPSPFYSKFIHARAYSDNEGDDGPGSAPEYTVNYQPPTLSCDNATTIDMTAFCNYDGSNIPCINQVWSCGANGEAQVSFDIPENTNTTVSLTENEEDIDCVRAEVWDGASGGANQFGCTVSVYSSLQYPVVKFFFDDGSPPPPPDPVFNFDVVVQDTAVSSPRYKYQEALPTCVDSVVAPIGFSCTDTNNCRDLRPDCDEFDGYKAIYVAQADPGENTKVTLNLESGFGNCQGWRVLDSSGGQVSSGNGCTAEFVMSSATDDRRVEFDVSTGMSKFPWEGPGVTGAYIDTVSNRLKIISKEGIWTREVGEGNWDADGYKKIVNSVWWYNPNVPNYPPKVGGRYPWEGPGVTAIYHDPLAPEGGDLKIISKDRIWTRKIASGGWIDGGQRMLEDSQWWYHDNQNCNPDHDPNCYPTPKVDGLLPWEGVGITGTYVDPGTNLLKIFSGNRLYTKDLRGPKWHTAGHVSESSWWNTNVPKVEDRLPWDDKGITAVYVDPTDNNNLKIFSGDKLWSKSNNSSTYHWSGYVWQNSSWKNTPPILGY